MDWWQQALIIAGFFVLRLGVPLAITLLVGYGLRRLDAKWQAEAAAQQAAEAEAGQRQAKVNNADNIDNVAEPAPELSQFCWVVRECSPARRSECPAYQRPYMLCWMARRQAEGQVPPECYGCALFSGRRVEQLHRN